MSAPTNQRAITALVASFAAVGLAGCACGGSAVAELVERQGTVERTAAGRDEWGDAPVGQEFLVGEAVRTGEGATARLRVGARGGSRMQPRTVLRFLSERPERPAGVRIESGEVELESEEAVDVETMLGTVTLVAGGRARIRSVGAQPRVEVIAGRVQFEQDGEIRAAEAGDSIVLAVGRVIFEDAEAPTFGSEPGMGTGARVGAGSGATAPGPGVAAGAAKAARAETGAGTSPSPEALAAGADEGGAEVETGAGEGGGGGRFEISPERAHLVIAAGESPVVHDPGPGPTAIRFAFGEACSGEGTVTLLGGRRPTRWRGTGSATVAVGPGRVRYAIRCEAGRAPGGAITVRHDDGSHRLQSVPPRNVVDADGRTYDVLYQNALPILVVRWRKAGSGALQLHVVSAGRDRAFPAPGGRAELPSGELGEGTHRVFFAAGARRSPETTVRIRFDNAAPTASLREPPAGALLSGPRAHVAGTVLAGFTVRAGGVELPVDCQQRFSGDVPIPPDLDALAVRISHPRRGVHSYLRRLAR